MNLPRPALMERRTWVRLDNASTIFLAAMNDSDTKVFRYSAEMSETVDAHLLQRALDQVYDEYVLYHAVLRRGIFWYYLEDSDLRPQVRPDEHRPCAQLYHYDRRELLFRVAHHHNRVILEVFHALSDGTGAAWFFQDLLTEYVRLRHPEISCIQDTAPKGVRHGLVGDSFAHYFRPGSTAMHDFAEAAETDVQRIAADPLPAAPKGPKVHHSSRPWRFRGTRTLDDRMRAIEVVVPLKEALSAAKRHKVSLTILLSAVFLESAHRVDAGSRTPRHYTVSVPVNLRQFFPSTSARNFFATTLLEYVYGEHGDDSLDAICASLNQQLKAQISPDGLAHKLRKLVSYELNPFMRVIIRPAKDLLLQFLNWSSNRTKSLSISNVGRFQLPPDVDPFVGAVYLMTPTVRPQFVTVSHADVLTISFTSPFIETDIEAQFVAQLQALGLSVTVAANRVRLDDLAGVQ